MTESVHTLPPRTGGEVRITIYEDSLGVQAYLMAGHLDETPQSWREQAVKDVSGVFTPGMLVVRLSNDEQAKIQRVIDESVDSIAPVQFEVRRGTFENKDSVALMLWADLHGNPWKPDQILRVACFPIAPWDRRLDAVEEGLLSMAKQRHARDEITKQAALSHNRNLFGIEDHAGAMPLDGLHLLHEIEPHDGDEDEYWAQQDLTAKPGPVELRCALCKQIVATWERPWEDSWTTVHDTYEAHNAACPARQEPSDESGS